MAKVYNNVLETIGNTPLVELKGISEGTGARVLGKLEFFNPANSVKDRIGKAIIDAAEASGQLKPGGTIVEGTSGNTGIALALAGAARGYKVILTMPETMSNERRVVLRAFGAEIVLTPGSAGMQGAVDKANEIVESTENAILASQFENEANPKIHYETTGPEIWNDTDGKVDILVAGVGTGGTISGAGKYLKEQNAEVKTVAVEPAASPLLSEGKAGPHKIQGLGANFIPGTYDRTVVDEILTVSNEDAVATSRELAVKDAVLGGISAGANVKAALEVASREENKDKTIVVIIPDFGERYVSTILYEDIRD
ncbi:cysteine synthase A [Corynebacterium cystitidis]|uniref:Cysteine synthase n=1 Tax=Corynebacterium cystitidis DSM 20524 TaxID=1121357 RepID=A0A1H9W3W8_9CORY|nr:cysteine synthase A [Corynebacterium cystitidis]WJY83021.1 O-acetylserine sulfhydrylase [Corynebacterium cystitidis DSM 20524]SES28441.1 cysteine synthase A [Corynebacterium cystitidis DSM 20524]SNV64991.1 cysteine synthase [Corynebacterium cystitidis]